MSKALRIISMVPSWTETLIECGVNVVGRTRFCIHPHNVEDIPIVGGTKDINWKKIQELHPDLILLDAEENPKIMAEECPFPWLTTHIRSVEDVEKDLHKMASSFGNEKLYLLATRWKNIATKRPNLRDLKDIPGIVSWNTPLPESVDQFVYLIWHNPWMAVSKKTFIGSVFNTLGLGESMIHFPTPYPEIDLSAFDPARTLLLFSTEPFPFGKKPQLMKDQKFPSALIDGESYSWFGTRTLKFLEESLASPGNQGI
jgi:hypothetical protein